MSVLLYDQHRFPFSLRLRLAMDAAKFKQVDLVTVTDRSQPTVSAWLDGRRQPSVFDVAVCAEVLGVSTDFLLGVVSVDELDRRRLNGIDCNLDAVMAAVKKQHRIERS